MKNIMSKTHYDDDVDITIKHFGFIRDEVMNEESGVMEADDIPMYLFTYKSETERRQCFLSDAELLSLKEQIDTILRTTKGPYPPRVEGNNE